MNHLLKNISLYWFEPVTCFDFMADVFPSSVGLGANEFPTGSGGFIIISWGAFINAPIFYQRPRFLLARRFVFPNIV